MSSPMPTISSSVASWGRSPSDTTARHSTSPPGRSTISTGQSVWCSFRRIQPSRAIGSALRTPIVKSFQMIGSVTMPLAMGIFATAPRICPGDAWREMAPDVIDSSDSCSDEPCEAPLVHDGGLVRGNGHPRYNVRAGLVVVGVLFPLMFVLLPFGAEGIAMAVFLAHVVGLGLQCVSGPYVAPGGPRAHAAGGAPDGGVDHCDDRWYLPDQGPARCSCRGNARPSRDPAGMHCGGCGDLCRNDVSYASGTLSPRFAICLLKADAQQNRMTHARTCTDCLTVPGVRGTRHRMSSTPSPTVPVHSTLSVCHAGGGGRVSQGGCDSRVLPFLRVHHQSHFLG